MQDIYQIHMYRQRRGDVGLKPWPIIGHEDVPEAAKQILVNHFQNSRKRQKPPTCGDVVGEDGRTMFTVRMVTNDKAAISHQA